MAEVNFIDGTALAPSSFGETKNGIWIPIDTSGLTFGTNGFRLKFDQVGVGTASTSTIGADTSGNTHHFTSSGIVASDCNMPDSPENNFMTFNPLMTISQGSNHPTTSEGNLRARHNGSDQYKYIWSTFSIKPNTGKWYFEVLTETSMGSTNDIAYMGLGTIGPTFSPSFSGSAGTVGPQHFYISWRGNTGARTLYINDDGQDATTVTVANMTAGQIWQFAVDTDSGKVWLGLNNTYYAADGGTDGNPSGGANECGTFASYNNELSFFTQAQNYNLGNVYYGLNTGQDSSFYANKTAQGNTDGNGIGDFYYAPPTGFLALCSANLPEPTIGPNSGANNQSDDHFNTLIYDGNDDATRTFNVGFVSDWSWFKARNADGIGHQLYDSSRGVTKYLASNTTGAEATNTEGVTSFNSSGLLAIGNSNFLNKSGRTHVLWNWKANGGTTTTNDASSTGVGSIDSVFQANTTAGFSIVQFEATGSAGTIAHGLSQAPNFMILKSRDQDGAQWVVYYGDNTDYVVLQGTDATVDGQSTWNDTSPTSTVFSVGVNGGDSNNSSGGSMIGYIFHDVEGYSKFGSYTGNGNADGAFVFTGFRPAFVLVKRSSTTGNWTLMDNTRKTFNFNNTLLYPNSNAAENSNDGYNGSDFVSNGFKIRGGSSGVGTDVSGTGTYIYMAFAEAPFKYANAR